jgi:hypothetical protein
MEAYLATSQNSTAIDNNEEPLAESLVTGKQDAANRFRKAWKGC